MKYLQRTKWISPLAVALCFTACDYSRDTGRVDNDDDELMDPVVARVSMNTSRENTNRNTADRHAAEEVEGLEASPIHMDFIAPDEIRLGEQAMVTFRLTNSSDTPLHDVNVIPQGAMKLSRDITGNSELTSEPLYVGSLGAQQTLEVDGLIQADQLGEIQRCFLVDYKTGFCASVTVVNPELEFTRELVDAEGNEVDQAFICEEIFAVYRLRNVGTGESDEVVVRDEFPSGILVSDTATPVWSIGSLDAGEEWTERVQLRVTNPTEYRGFAIAETDNTRLQSESDSINFYETQIALNLQGPRNHMMYRTALYEATVTNIGDYPAYDLTLQLEDGFLSEVEEQYTTQDEFDENGAFQVKTLQPGESRTISFFADFDEVGEVAFNVTADGWCVADSKEEELVTLVQGVPALRLEMIDTVDPVIAGEATAYRVRVKNQGTAQDTNIAVRVQLPDNLDFIDGEGETALSHEDGMITFGGVTEIDPQETVEWTFTAKSTSASKVITRAELSSQAIKEAVMEEEPTNVVAARVR
jgi:hypothetical protein